MTLHSQNKKNINKLFLAPMEGLGNFPFRNAIAHIGGFDEATQEFISVPKNASIKSLVNKYQPKDTFPIPQAAQIMGNCPYTLSDMTQALIEKGAQRVELNVGCPSNTVTGKGSGSSLLKDPDHLFKILDKMVSLSSIPISAKLRAGYEDTSLFKDNLIAAQSAGISHLTLHARTKAQGYKGLSDLNLIRKAKELLSIPLIGNGDIKNKNDAENMLSYTNCDGIMIGRGAVINPWIFHEIKGNHKLINLEDTLIYLEKFYSNIQTSPTKSQIGQLKQFFSFLFQKNNILLQLRKQMLRSKEKNSRLFFEFYKTVIAEYFFYKGVNMDIILSVLLIIVTIIIMYLGYMLPYMGTIFIILSILKLIDIKGFAKIFSQYDLLAKRYHPYSFIYPFIELFLGILFLLNLFIKIAAVVTIFIMTIGIISIIKKLLSKEQDSCACLGAKIHVPLTRFTLVEDIIMALMALMLLIY